MKARYRSAVTVGGTALAVLIGGAAAARVGGARAFVVREGLRFANAEVGVVREPMTWGCSGERGAAPDARIAATTDPPPIPPEALAQDLSALRLGKTFPREVEYSFPIPVGKIGVIESEFCTLDETLTCLAPNDRAKEVRAIVARIDQILKDAPKGSLTRSALSRFRERVRNDRVPVVHFANALHHGPTAGILRFQERATGKWILGLALAKDFFSAGESALFLDGVLVQEMVHYDDLSFLPAPLRCYESNIEIRGHHAMLEHWTAQGVAAATAHPRVQLLLTAGLDRASTRERWYRYLDRVEKTDFVMEDELASLEYLTLPQLAATHDEDARFLAEVQKVVTSAVDRATHLQSNVARLSADSINVEARHISAVSRLTPRLMFRYEASRAGMTDGNLSGRRRWMAAEQNAIQRGLQSLETLKGQLAADPDFRRKSDFAVN